MKVKVIFALLMLCFILPSCSISYQIEDQDIYPYYYLLDSNGDVMKVSVDPYLNPSLKWTIFKLNQVEIHNASIWVGGQIELTDNEFGWQFKPDTVRATYLVPKQLRAFTIQQVTENFEYWSQFESAYVWAVKVF